MIAQTLNEMVNLVQAKLCYQLFITPIHLPIEKPYRAFARQACEYFTQNRTEVIHCHEPRHHVIHRFSKNQPGAKKILIAHGWMSRAAYMSRLIHMLHQRGFDVYALDFPAHGEAKGLQLPWTDAVKLLQQIMNQLGPFYGVIGHSFGGSMLLNTLNLSSQFPEWRVEHEPERVILIASPTRMRTPVSRLARRFKLKSKGFVQLRELFRQNAITDLRHLDFHRYTNKAQTPFLCIHGTNDHSISPYESEVFCRQYPNASLALLPGADHVNVLWDERVEKAVRQFLF